MAQQLPIIFNERINLSTQGIDRASIRFNELTMESDQCICIREKQNGSNVLTTVDMEMGNQIVRRQIAAEAAIMNPTSRVIAVRGGQNLQIFNTETKSKLKSYKLPDGTEIKYWRWVNNKTVAFVTATSAYHWSMDGGEGPRKMFDRHASFPTNAQVINYQASEDGKWLLIVGISKGGDGNVVGSMQLYSVDKKVSQPLMGFSGCFQTIKRSDGYSRIMFCFIEKKPNSPFKLYVMEVGKDKDAAGGVFKLPPRDIAFPADATDDFPVSLLPSKHDILYMITKKGYLYLFDIHTASLVFCNRITTDTVFVSCPMRDGSGVLGVTSGTGQVLQVAVNEQTLVPYLVSLGNQNQLAMQLAARLNLPGASEMYVTEFNRLFQAGDYKGAAKIAAESGQSLRTQETIQRFLSIPQQQGQPQPVLMYFSTLLEKGKLNSIETLELARRVLQQGRQQMLENWLKEDKLECSEELGDMVIQSDPKMALSIYLRANVPEKVVQCFMLNGDYQNIVAYSVKVGYQPNYVVMLQNLVHQNPKQAEEFAKSLVNNEGGRLVDVGMVVDVFMQLNRIEETTSFLLDALKGNRAEEGQLQTRLLEINLLGGAPQVADAIFASEMFSYYDRPHIAQLCEKSGLYQRALELYTDIEDIKRVIVHTQTISPEFLVEFFGTQTAENCLACLNVLMMHNIKANLQIVVQAATKYSEHLGANELIQLFESYKSYEGLYYFCGSILSVSQDPDVHFKYIEAAAKMGQFDAVIRVCRESNFYDPEKVKEFLLMEKLQDPRPLIHVCDRHGYVGELTSYLYNSKLLKHIEVYVQKVSPQRTPEVIGKLLDLDCDEEFIKQLLDSVRSLCPVDPLVAQVEERNRLRMLQPFLEQRVAEGNTEPATHNAIGKIYITINKEPQEFLLNNQFYDSKVVGKFCEKLNPALAFLAYKRAWGQCDDELIEVTNSNELFKDQARYCVERQDMALWERVLANDNPHRRRVIDETVQTALPESKNPDEVSTTVKAFMTAELPNELIELLEKIVLQGDEFSNNKNLQNLLILTAIKADSTRVMDYIHRLDNFDGPDIAKIACSDQYELFEEAFEIYKKVKLNVQAIDVLLNHLEDLDRGVQFAERCDESDVWTHLAKAQLSANLVKEAIDSYIKSNDPTEHYKDVIDAAEREDQWEDLVRFLTMARKKIKERTIDTELIFSLAKIRKLGELEEFVASPNVADIQGTGDRCFDQGMFEAAKILFSNISNNAKLASCFLQLKSFREAVEAAKKANSIKTWKEVNAACVSKDEFRLAQICGLHIIVSPDHLEDLIGQYEKRGNSEELISLMEQGIDLDNAHTGVFTELGILYSKYRPEALKEHVRMYWSRMNIPKMLRACERARLWEESVFLMIENKEFDSAINCMIEHPESAWDDSKFLDCIVKVRNQELYYKGASFYLEYAPMQLNKLLNVLAKKVDHARVVQVFRKTDNLPLIMPYLKSVQGENVAAVNEAYNEVLVEEEDHEKLRESIDEHDNFDQIALAQKLEKHELLEFRRISAYLYKKNKRYGESVRLSKTDKMYKDAIDTAADSRDEAVVEELMKFFVNIEDKECFCAALYTCYDLVRPDLVLELAWRNELTDFAMPFIIQYMSEMHDRVRELEKRTAEKPAEEEQASGGPETFMSPPGTFMLANQAYQPQQQPPQQFMQQAPNGGMMYQQQQPPGGFPPQQQQGGFQ
ncbi:Clathrin heavy chain 1 [Durusdinium trenchii]|uniref:Clathrin heavy chain n=1 Tax=Durusdinium trenchii TaxID=1381693 RepID=A0ABP0HC52_9DINO